MKRFFSFVLSFALVLSLCAAAFADVDLTGMSFDELVALKDKINLAIWNSQEWQEVEVPQGVWAVGADIPAGKWTIRALEGDNCGITVGTEVESGGTEVKYKYGDIVFSESSFMYSPGSLVEYTVDLQDGEYIEISISSAIFTPYAGKPALGFK